LPLRGNGGWWRRTVERRRTIKLKAPQYLPKVITVQQVQAILDPWEHLRDRMLFALMLDTSVRAGEALGLRHEAGHVAAAGLGEHDLGAALRLRSTTTPMAAPRRTQERSRVRSTDSGSAGHSSTETW